MGKGVASVLTAMAAGAVALTWAALILADRWPHTAAYYFAR